MNRDKMNDIVRGKLRLGLIFSENPRIFFGNSFLYERFKVRNHSEEKAFKCKKSWSKKGCRF